MRKPALAAELANRDEVGVLELHRGKGLAGEPGPEDPIGPPRGLAQLQHIRRTQAQRPGQERPPAGPFSQQLQQQVPPQEPRDSARQLERPQIGAQ